MQPSYDYTNNNDDEDYGVHSAWRVMAIFLLILFAFLAGMVVMRHYDDEHLADDVFSYPTETTEHAPVYTFPQGTVPPYDIPDDCSEFLSIDGVTITEPGPECGAPPSTMDPPATIPTTISPPPPGTCVTLPDSDGYPCNKGSQPTLPTIPTIPTTVPGYSESYPGDKDITFLIDRLGEGSRLVELEAACPLTDFEDTIHFYQSGNAMYEELVDASLDVTYQPWWSTIYWLVADESVVEVIGWDNLLFIDLPKDSSRDEMFDFADRFAAALDEFQPCA